MRLATNWSPLITTARLSCSSLPLSWQRSALLSRFAIGPARSSRRERWPSWSGTPLRTRRSSGRGFGRQHKCLLRVPRTQVMHPGVDSGRPGELWTRTDLPVSEQWSAAGQATASPSIDRLRSRFRWPPRSGGGGAGPSGVGTLAWSHRSAARWSRTRVSVAPCGRGPRGSATGSITAQERRESVVGPS